jgi:hypothetical protein
LNKIGYAMIVPQSREDRALEIAIEIIRINAEKDKLTTIEDIYNVSKLHCKTGEEHTYMFGEGSTTYENKKLRKIMDQLDKAVNIRVLHDKPRMWTYDKSQITFDKGKGKT